ncbi:MAG: hypothetical protein R2792_13340 [Saprospiraceae bacterium]
MKAFLLTLLMLGAFCSCQSDSEHTSGANSAGDTVVVVQSENLKQIDYTLLLEQRNYFKAPEAKIISYLGEELVRYYHYNSKIYIERIAADGEIRWKKQFFFGVNNVMNELAKGPDDRIYCLSRTFDDEHQINATLFCLDQDGELQWKKMLGNLKADHFLLHDQTISLIGYTGDLESYTLIQTDLDGDVKKEQGIKKLQFFNLSKMALDQDGNYLMFGGKTPPTQANQSDILILKMSPKGKILKRFEIGSPQNDWASDGLCLPDGRILCIAGWEADMSTNKHQKKILCLDPKLKLLWERRLQFANSWTDNSLLFQDKNQHLYSISSGTTPEGGNSIYLISYSETGQMENIYYLPESSRVFAPYGVSVAVNNAIRISTNAGIVEVQPDAIK